MDNLYKLILVLFLLTVSGLSHAVTFTAAMSQCTTDYNANQGYPKATACYDYQSGSIRQVRHGWVQSGYPLVSFTYTETSCTAPATLNTTTHQCVTPVVCNYPEVRDSVTNTCKLPECTSTTKWNYTAGQCATPPSCGTTETFNAYTFQCELKKLNCPVNSHPNTANDACLPDPPRGCPTGQHDDGTYNCVANDAIGCTSDQVKGYINGIPQCIKKTNHDEAAAKADAEKQKQATADAQNEAAQTAAATAAAAAAADPTNTTKQEAAATAAAAASDADIAAKKAKADADQAQADGDSESLQSIAQSTKELADRDADDRKAGFGDTPIADTISNSEQTTTGIASGSSFGSCPAPYNIATHQGNITMSFQPQCDFAQKISPLVLAFAFLSAGLIVLGPIRD